MEKDKETGFIPRILKQLASLKLTVVCLLFLVVLVFWGTVYQADHGLYQAQQKFFYSWFFLAFGFLPVPGTVLVLFTLTINLVASVFFRIGFRLSNIGNFITHTGLIILFIGGGLTFFFSVESTLGMFEGEINNKSFSRNLWEVAVWEQTDGKDLTYAIDAKGLSPEKKIPFGDIGIDISIIDNFVNSTPVFNKTGEDNLFTNSSGIQSLNKVKPALEGGDNIAGITFFVNKKKSPDNKLILYGKDRNPTQVLIDGRKVNFQMRKKQYILPITVRLKDVAAKRYPNSQIVKSYESLVEIKDKQGMVRDVKISMNKPLRYDDLTFFQSGYGEQNNREYSVFSVVKNSGRLLPYVSSLFIFIGLIIHFFMMLYRRRKNQIGGEK